MKPKNTLTERVLALLLALVTATALVPAPALAEAVDEHVFGVVDFKPLAEFLVGGTDSLWAVDGELVGAVGRGGVGHGFNHLVQVLAHRGGGIAEAGQR